MFRAIAAFPAMHSGKEIISWKSYIPSKTLNFYLVFKLSLVTSGVQSGNDTSRS